MISHKNNILFRKALPMLVAGISVLFALKAAAADSVSLAGTWAFQLDPKDAGEREHWFTRKLDDFIALPGTTDQAGKGAGVLAANAAESIHPQMLDADRSNKWVSHLSRRFPYVGAAWFQRDIDLPQAWEGRRMVIRLERTKVSSAWLDGNSLGQQDSLIGEHTYCLPKNLKAGRHQLTVKVDNRLEKIPARGHQVSDDTQTNWNGILGELRLQVTDRVWVEQIAVYPSAASKSARVCVTLGNERGVPTSGQLTLHCAAPGIDFEREIKFTEARDGQIIETRLDLGPNAPLWDEFQPILHHLSVAVSTDSGEKDSAETRFGLRDFSTRGTQFVLNGRPVFLRGKHDACVFPITGYAPMNKDAWLHYFKTCRDYGLNHVRFHTWCPPRPAFDAADEMGFLLQPELANFGGSLGTDTGLRRYSMEEAHRMLREFGNSPSFAMFALGNELFGWPETRSAMIRELRTVDPRRLYTQVSNPDFDTCRQNEGDDYWITFRSQSGASGNVRGSYSHADLPLGHVQQGPANTLHDYSKAISAATCPLVSHEVGQYQVYPDFQEISRYTGVLRAINFEIFRERLGSAGMLEQAHDFFRASGALAAINYREEIEAALRTPGMGGFQLLDLQDFPGQGTALVGILNAFMESKGAVTAEEWRNFCNATVVLAKFPKYTWRAGESFSSVITVAHYGPQPTIQTLVEFVLKDAAGQEWARGSSPIIARQGCVTTATDQIKFVIPSDLRQAECMTLELKLKDYPVQNRYRLWAYPASNRSLAGSVTMARRFDETTRRTLEKGGRVLYIPEVSAFPAKSVKGFFASDFWCYPMFKHVAIANKKEPAPGTLGILIQNRHPALAGFPTEFHSDYQWFDIVNAGSNIVLDAFPKAFTPIVQGIDNFERNHRLGMIFEARVGAGRLLVCVSDLVALANKPEAACLLDSLKRYAASDEFSPKAQISPDLAEDALASKK